VIERTRVGIVEWTARGRCARTFELLLADAFGKAALAARETSLRVVLARHARHHAFHASLWESVDAVLHDAEPARDACADLDVRELRESLSGEDELVPFRRAVNEFLPTLIGVYRRWASETGTVADRPQRRVLELVLSDEARDLAEARAVVAVLER
jgi:hypothetical protein